MSWGQRLKRVFGIDIRTCSACGGAVRIIACIEDAKVIGKILTHLDTRATAPKTHRGRHAVHRPSAVCLIDRDAPTTTICGYGVDWRGGRGEREAHRAPITAVDWGDVALLRGDWHVEANAKHHRMQGRAAKRRSAPVTAGRPAAEKGVYTSG